LKFLLPSAIRDVHRDFHTEAEIHSGRSFPFHERSSFWLIARSIMESSRDAGHQIIIKLAS
jgi:hypothetical protein